MSRESRVARNEKYEAWLVEHRVEVYSLSAAVLLFALIATFWMTLVGIESAAWRIPVYGLIGLGAALVTQTRRAVKQRAPGRGTDCVRPIGRAARIRASRSRRLSRRTATSTTSMPPFGLASACSSSASDSTRQCGVRVAAQRLARSTPWGVPNSRLVPVGVRRVALLEHREDRAAVVVDDHDRQVRPGLVGPEDQAVGVVQERHVAHQRERSAACAGGRGRRRSPTRRCRRCRTGRGWRSPCGGRRPRTSATIRSRSRIGLEAPTNSSPSGGSARLTAPATPYGVSALGGEQRVELPADGRVGRPPRVEPGRVVGLGRARAVGRRGRRRANGRSGPHAAARHRRSTSTSSRPSSRVTGRDSVGCPNTTTRSISRPSSPSSSSR